MQPVCVSGMALSRLFLCVILGLATVGKIHCLDVTTPGGSGADVVEEVVDMIKASRIFPDDKKFLCRVAWVESKYGTDRNTYRKGYHGGIWQVSGSDNAPSQSHILPRGRGWGGGGGGEESAVISYPVQDWTEAGRIQNTKNGT